MRTRTLIDMELGETGFIQELSIAGSAGKRLMDLGFIGGVQVALALVSPLGNPRAYRVAGAMIALRNADAKRVAIKPLERSERT